MAANALKKLPKDWNEFTYKGRIFVNGIVSKGVNKGKQFKVARRLGERYEVTNFFASGGCGLILCGIDSHTGSGVLIKSILNYDVVHEAGGRDADGIRKRVTDARRQLQTERRIMVQLKNRGCNAIPNPNDYVIDWNPSLEGPYSVQDGSKWRFDDASTIEGEPYLIMEEIHGKPVEDLIGAGMEERRAIRIMHEVCGVLAVAHQPMTVGSRIWNLVYQDLKPANILIGDQDYVSLLDWGGCKLTMTVGQETKIGLNGANTPGYCAPECESGLSLSPAADSYTVGSTLYHMLSGTNPMMLLQSNGLVGTRKSIKRQEWDFESLKKRVHSETVKFVQLCVDESPKLRPVDGNDLVKLLSALVKQL